MPQDVLPGRSYDVRCVVELPDIHGFGLTSLSLSKGLPLFTNLRRLNLARISQLAGGRFCMPLHQI